MIRVNFKKAIDEYEKMIAEGIPIDMDYLSELLEPENERDAATNMIQIEIAVGSGIFDAIIEERNRREAEE